MSLRDCYAQRTGYFLSLQKRMNQHVAATGLNVPNTEIVKAFCYAFGNVPLNTIEDYNRTLDEFRAFTTGISWAMQH